MHILILHDGELDDVCGLLGQLGGAYAERRGDAPLPEKRGGWDLVVATPDRVERAAELIARPESRSIVVAEAGERPLEASFARLGVDLVVRRPVHPATLRLLFLHALYRGPERRHAERVLVGLPISVRVGWRPRRAVLSELSLGGASLHIGWSVRPGRNLVVRLPGSRAIAVPGEVVEIRRASAGEGGFEARISFRLTDARMLRQLRDQVTAYNRGPAVWPEVQQDEEPSVRDRRGEERRPYARRVIALSDAGPRVLLGSDLSLGGMRVSGSAGLRPGERLRVALHVKPGEVPLVVGADVVRDDGEGLGVRFLELTDRERTRLDKMLGALAPVVAPDEDDGDPRILAEVLGEGEAPDA